jgi:hypothetical protein
MDQKGLFRLYHLQKVLCQSSLGTIRRCQPCHGGLTGCTDRINYFEFRRGKKPDGTENYIPFLSASPGQQATCLSETLLAQDGAPLLIDQPEEDLDNEQIQSVSERISSTKSLLQLLFVSHNAKYRCEWRF